MEVEGPYMHPNQRLILIKKWCDTRDIQLTFEAVNAWESAREKEER